MNIISNIGYIYMFVRIDVNNLENTNPYLMSYSFIYIINTTSVLYHFNTLLDSYCTIYIYFYHPITSSSINTLYIILFTHLFINHYKIYIIYLFIIIIYLYHYLISFYYYTLSILTPLNHSSIIIFFIFNLYLFIYLFIKKYILYLFISPLFFPPSFYISWSYN
jgi:hypothetical protein